MRIALRVDSSERIGTGHVMRCLSLAGQLRRRGAEPIFVSRRLTRNIVDDIERLGYPICELGQVDSGAGGDSWLPVSREQDAEETVAALSGLGCQWLVVDHYELDASWERRLRSVVPRIMVIDDLANRAHDCDLLLDQGYYRDAASRYQGLVPEGCVTLLGPSHALLREEFEQVATRERDGRVERILVSFGGVDRSNETQKCLSAIASLDGHRPEITAVAGPANPNVDALRRWCAAEPVTLYDRVSDMARQMNEADLAIGAGGTSTLERLRLGLPAVTIAIADNQRRMLAHLAETGAIWHLGDHREVTVEALRRLLTRLLTSPAEVRRAAARAFALGCGDATGTSGQQVVDALLDSDVL